MSKKQIASPDQWVYALILLIIFYLVFKLIINLGWLDWLNIGSGQVSLGIAFLIGIVASLSTCLAVVGAVVISFAAKYKVEGTVFQTSVRPHLIFHLGRLGSFFILGGILGLIGDWFSLSGPFMGWFTILIAIVLLWMGLNILGLVPPICKYGVRLPRKTMKTWQKLQESEHPYAPIIIGAFTFFLPCGFTQSMQLFAISTGSFWTGSITMFLFALGTVPVLLGLGFATSRFQAAKATFFKLMIGLIVVVFAYLTFASGLAQTGLEIAWPTSQHSDVSAQINNGVQLVQMEVDYRGYEPSSIQIQSGVPVRWEINAKQLTGCTSEIIVPDLDIRQKLTEGINIIEFTPTSLGTIGFSCWMGMVRGKFIVE